MDAMTIPDVWSGQDRALTVADMEDMPDDEFRYELDDGVLIVSPAPSTLHQLVVGASSYYLALPVPMGWLSCSASVSTSASISIGCRMWR